MTPFYPEGVIRHSPSCALAIQLQTAPLRMAAVELDEVRPAGDPDSRVRPFKDEVLGEQLSN